MLVIGDEILSGRTKDRNIGYIAEYLGHIGVDLREARVVPDIEEEIVAALNALRARYDYVFTTGGIGPTHDDITADAVAKAFGVDDRRTSARARDDAASATSRDELTPARRRMARMPDGAELVENPVSKAPGFRHRQCHRHGRRAGVMQAMLDYVGQGARDRRADGGRVDRGRRDARRALRRGLGALAEAHAEVSIGSYPVVPRRDVPQPDRRAQPRRRTPPRRAAAVEAMLADSRRADAGDAALGKAVDGARAASRGAPPLAKEARPGAWDKAAMTDRSQKAFPVSWDQFHRDARALAWRLSAAGPFEALVAITRGGLVPAAIVSRELELRMIETVCIASYHDYNTQGGLQVLKTHRRAVSKSARRQILVDRRSGRHRQDRQVGARNAAQGPFRHRLRQAARPAAGRHLRHRVSQDTWIYFPWDMGLAFQPPIAKDAAG